jgi:hypothetical protein
VTLALVRRHPDRDRAVVHRREAEILFTDGLWMLARLDDLEPAGGV